MKKRYGFVLCFLFAACGGSTTSTTVTDTTATVPSDIVVSSPTATASASASIAKPTFVKATGDAEGDDFESKKEALQNLLAATGECSFTLALPSVSDVACYGPKINYNGHPNASVPDGNTEDATNPEDDDGKLPVGDTGIWDATQGTEACAAAKANELIEKVASKVDNMISIFGAMACAGKKADIALPAVGASVDLASALSTHASISGVTFTTATLERLADDSDANAVYRSTLVMTMNFGANGSKTVTVILKHIPTADDNSTYKGKLSMSMATATGSSGNCSGVGAAVGSVDAGTILYEKSSATSVIYELNFATFCGGTTDPFDDDNNISSSDKATVSNTDGWADNWNYGIFSLNPSNATASVAFAWQAGQGDGNTRVLNISTTEAADGSVSGNAYYGFGADIATGTQGAITGFICNWAGPGNNHSASLVQKAQRQVLSRGISETEFTATSSNITYALNNGCDATASDGFIYEATSSDTYQAVGSAGANALNLDNDRDSDASNLTNNLINLTDIVFTLPTAPDDV